MKKIILYFLPFLCFTVINYAQSGRVVKPQTTPTPAVRQSPQSPQSPQSEENTTFSESVSNPKRRISPNPVPNNTPPTETKKQKKKKQNQPIEMTVSDEDSIKVETNLISIPVSVFNRNGLYIPDLSKENFQIFENGKPQKIEYFATTENPFTVVLLLDTSPSTEYQIEEIQSAAIAFVNQLKPQDSVMVIEFDGNVHVLTEATTDREKISKGIRKADFGGGTSLYDAVDFSLRKRLAKISGRKAIVLFTDGVDTTSGKADYESTVREAEEADATIFPIYYNTFTTNLQFNRNMRGTSREEYAIGIAYLKDLSESTGGRVFSADAKEGGLTRTFESIAEELRHQYSIGYIPEETGQTGQRKQIKVRVNRPNLVIRARDSYIVGEQNANLPPTTKK